MKRFLMFALLLIAGSLAAWHFYFSPDAVKKRAIARTLSEMDAAVGTEDRAKISAFLDHYLLPDASITLNVDMAGGVYAQAVSPMKETFTKPNFIRFIDLTLYSVDKYAMSTRLAAYTPLPDGNADAGLSTSASAEGDAYFNGFTMKARFEVTGDCSGHAVFDTSGVPHLQSSTCQLSLRIVPRPEAQDFQHLKDTLNRYQKP